MLVDRIRIVLNFYIYLAVVVCGAAVLAIELLGTRIIGPFYGVSLYSWSALISVTLAALSIGYVVGGRLADREAKLRHFCTIIGLAGVWCTAIPLMRHPMLLATENMGLRAAVLVTAVALFLPPLALLGMVSPYAIRLKASSLEVVGRTAGNLYALSTIAGVLAAISTGFFLVPNVGVSRLTYLVGIALVVTALLGIAVNRKGLYMWVGLLALPVVGGAAVSMVPSRKADPDAGLIALEQSAYAEIRVVDQDGVRSMLIDGGTHTIVDPETWEPLFPYVDVLDLAKGYYERPGRMLLVGLGGGSVARSFAGDGWEVDAVEIDPVVTDIAHRFFGLDASVATVHDQDGRQFLIENDQIYDLIILDAFGSSSIPFHLVTREAFGLARHRLAPSGVLAMNVEAVGWHDELVHALFATLRQQFAHVLALPMAEPPNQLGNVVLLASGRDLTLSEEPPVPRGRTSHEYNRAHAWDNRFEVDVTGVQILTDELNPVDVWAERINLVARKRLHAYFKSPEIGW